MTSCLLPWTVFRCFIIIFLFLFLFLVLSKGDNPSRADIVLFGLVIPRIKTTDWRRVSVSTTVHWTLNQCRSDVKMVKSVLWDG